jgi:D-alanyl-D-alanine carboxypeptidase
MFKKVGVIVVMLGVLAGYQVFFGMDKCNGGAVCGIFSKLTGAKEKVVLEKEIESGKKFEVQNLFPVDKAFASGFVPIRKNDSKDLNLWAGSSVAIDVDSGTVLHYDDGRRKSQIASLTKMMTGILVIEHISDLNDEVNITKEALNLPGTVVGCPTSVFCNASRMHIGEKVKAIDLMRAMLMNSANDAATALGIHVAGTSEKFVEMMNKKAQTLGLKDTHFCTPSGLEIDGEEDQCYSTAYDIARIAAYSMRYDVIWNIMRIPEGTFYSTDGKCEHALKNTDVLLDTLPNCIGGKTGFTPMAGKSLMLGITDESKKHKVVAVVLNDENRWEDMRTLTNWVFENYKWQ